ncbi:hypothetical protein AVEN_94705-1 [Araneus ventricosus]|uniref:PiggyBac transposable element-derived protein domain-containing protein n=1 Tax=Araneus ventricosus TaxID=182803 RepID=A0A4Y2CN97_ARAVE|nr:hypothetical protein AVEN_94705-1 [Araneus ventricosus]
MKFLHFENSDAFDENLHLNPKLREVSELHSMLMLVQRFKSVYVPKQDMPVDESLIAYKRRLGWKQYIPNKRARFGLKLFNYVNPKVGRSGTQAYTQEKAQSFTMTAIISVFLQRV